ncbi:MAG: diaminopimelate dehydrogenase, partial [Clostridia bacterium]|nr:diaminopimelate dehydrogenase [Clostridia bacterium]
TIEYALTLESNPDFTGSVLVAFARAAYRLGQRGEVGCKTAFDIAPIYLSPESPEELYAHLL